MALVEEGNLQFSELKEKFFWAEIYREIKKNEDKILIERDLFLRSFLFNSCPCFHLVHYNVVLNGAYGIERHQNIVVHLFVP